MREKKSENSNTLLLRMTSVITYACCNYLRMCVYNTRVCECNLCRPRKARKCELIIIFKSSDYDFIRTTSWELNTNVILKWHPWMRFWILPSWCVYTTRLFSSRASTALSISLSSLSHRLLPTDHRIRSLYHLSVQPFETLLLISTTLMTNRYCFHLFA